MPESLGIDFIICDHHQPPEVSALMLMQFLMLFSRTAITRSKVCAVREWHLSSYRQYAKSLISIHGIHLLDFVAVATAADMVPVIDENRTLISFGFKQILNEPRPSFRTIFKNSSLKLEHITTSNVVFTIGPRINAVGRLGDATRAVKFLTSETVEEAEELNECSGKGELQPQEN